MCICKFISLNITMAYRCAIPSTRFKAIEKPNTKHVLQFILCHPHSTFALRNKSDFHYTYPPPIGCPQHILIALNGKSQRYKMYAPMANKTYYRWMYHKAKNAPAKTQADINSLKPRVTFPDVSAFSTISQGTVSIFNPPTASYKLLCIPNNWALSYSTCLVKNASNGSAPFGFGTADPVVSTIFWADSTAFAEWHCFEGDRQVFNVISLRKFLTKRQTDSIVNLVVRYGFSANNIDFQVYN